MPPRLLLTLLLTSTVVGPCLAQVETPALPEGSIRPGINDNYFDPDIDVEEWIQRFEVESREVYKYRKEILEQVALKPGDRVADIGTGTGLFVEPFSEAVGPKGWVFALDIAPKFIERVGGLVELKRLGNVTPVLTGRDELRLPPHSVTTAFVCDVYHHFEFPVATLTSIFDALEPGGTFVVVDFERIPGVSREWVLNHVRAGKDVVRKEIEASGFEFVEEVSVSGIRENYFLRFRKP
ncbi:MAG: class I SAM-dependent methyltransferase [Aeoliella sp.]